MAVALQDLVVSSLVTDELMGAALKISVSQTQWWPLGVAECFRFVHSSYEKFCSRDTINLGSVECFSC